MFENPYLVGGVFTAGRGVRQQTVRGRTVGFTYGDIPYPYGWNLYEPYASRGCCAKKCCSPHASPYGPYSTQSNPRYYNPVFGL